MRSYTLLGLGLIVSSLLKHSPTNWQYALVIVIVLGLNYWLKQGWKYGLVLSWVMLIVALGLFLSKAEASSVIAANWVYLLWILSLGQLGWLKRQLLVSAS